MLAFAVIVPVYTFNNSQAFVSCDYDTEGFQQCLGVEGSLGRAVSYHPVRQQHDLIANSGFFLNIVGGQDNRCPTRQFTFNCLQIEVTSAGIQSGSRLIQYQQISPVGQHLG